MADTRFWRTLAVLFVAGVFYLAHGLHDPDAIESLPSLTQELHAGDVATATLDRSHVKIITSSDDGRTINVWTSTTSSTGTVTFRGSYSAK